MTRATRCLTRIALYRQRRMIGVVVVTRYGTGARRRRVQEAGGGLRS